MKLKNVIKKTIEQVEKKDLTHINILEKQILSKISKEKSLDKEMKDYFPPQKSSWVSILPYAFAAIFLFVFFFVATAKSTVSAQTSILEVLTNLRNALEQELTKLIYTDPTYQDRSTQKYKQAQEELCLLSARPPEARERAVTAIRLFLDRPDAIVEYECNDKAKENLDGEPTKESYIIDFDRFVVDIKTNRVIEMSPREANWGENMNGTFWFSPQKQYDYTLRYTQEEAEKLARDFITNHENAVGEIDLNKLSLETNKKENGMGKINYFLTWKGNSQKRELQEPYKLCSPDMDTKEADSFDKNGVPCTTVSEETYIPQLIVTFTQGGQIVNYSNNLTR